MRNLHRRFDSYYIGQIWGGDFEKFCGLLRIYELYIKRFSNIGRVRIKFRRIIIFVRLAKLAKI